MHQMSENVAGGKEWEKRMTGFLKASKLYLKGDFKVMILALPFPREYSIYPWVRRCGPAPQTLTVPKTKNVRFLMPCLRIFAKKEYPV